MFVVDEYVRNDTMGMKKSFYAPHKIFRFIDSNLGPRFDSFCTFTDQSVEQN